MAGNEQNKNLQVFQEWRDWDREKLDKIYSPSAYNKRLSAEGVILAHQESVDKVYNEVIKTLPVKKDISYGPTEGQKMDIFNDNLQTGAAIFVFIHGGYWAAMSKAQGCFIINQLVKQAACSVVLVEYDLAPKVDLETIIRQVQTAARLIIEIAKAQESSGVYFSGHSAGAHLAAMIATSPWLQNDSEAKKLIKGYICLSGIYDLRPLVKSYVNDTLNMTEEGATSMSPFFQRKIISSNVTEKCQFLVFVGENESPEFIRQSQDFHQALEEIGIQAKYLMIPNVDHFDLMEKLVDADYNLTQEIIKFVTSGSPR